MDNLSLHPAHGFNPVMPVDVPASGPGALDGFQAVCHCGWSVTYSLRSMVLSDMTAHIRYYNDRAARPAQYRDIA